jgi:hypothetical protein
VCDGQWGVDLPNKEGMAKGSCPSRSSGPETVGRTVNRDPTCAAVNYYISVNYNVFITVPPPLPFRLLPLPCLALLLLFLHRLLNNLLLHSYNDHDGGY